MTSEKTIKKLEGFRPSDIFDELKNADFDPSIFDQIDERDIPKAPNFLEWVVSPKYLNTRILPRQVEIGTKLLADWCPDCSNPGYIDTLFDQSIGNIRENIQFLEHGKCPKCAKTRFDLVKERKFVLKNELVARVGQRGGKTKLVGLLASYSTHRFLKISNPLRYFNQPSGELLMGTFSALTADQAAQTLWESYKGFVESSPWFQSYHRFLKTEGKRLGVELLHELKTSTGYTHKQMLWHATGSEDRKMRGRTRIFAAIDELGWFTSDESKPNLQFMNADAVYTALSNSLATMRMKFNQLWGETNYDSPPIIMANISSPSSAKDKIMRLEKSARDNPKMLAVAFPTWGMNNDYTYDSLRAEFASMSDEAFMRDFGAEPPLAANPFLSDPKVIDKIAYGEMDQAIVVVPILDKDRMGDGFKSVKLVSTIANKTFPRLIAFDLGFRKNALAACVFSLSPDSKPRLDFAIAVYPDKGTPVNTVHFFENFTVPLVSLFQVKHAFFDRWQSLDQIQRLKDLGVKAQTHSLTYKDMDSVRGLILSQSVIIPKMDKSMVEHVKDYIDDKALSQAIPNLGMQLLTVRDLGHRMEKPLMGDDDLFRAFCLGVVALSDQKIKDQYSILARKLQSGQTVRALGTIRSLGGDSGGTGYSPSSGGQSGVVGTVRPRSVK